MRKGEVYWVNLEGSDHEQRNRRPVIIVQDDLINEIATTTIIVPCTGNLDTAEMRTAVRINTDNLQISGDTVALCHQVRVIDKERLGNNCAGHLDVNQISKINETLQMVFGFFS